jgi:hypothetical protein
MIDILERSSSAYIQSGTKKEVVLEGIRIQLLNETITIIDFVHWNISNSSCCSSKDDFHREAALAPAEPRPEG